MSKSVFDFTPDEARAYLKKKGKVRLAVLHMSHEGQMIRTGGVGAVVQGHLSTTPLLAEALAKRGVEITMYTAQPISKAGCEGWNPKALEYVKKQTAKTGGYFQPLLNGTDGTVRWGDVENWKVSSAAGAAWALDLASRHDAAIVYSHSFPFAFSPIYGLRAAEAFGADVFFVQGEHGHYEKPEIAEANDPWKVAYDKIVPQYREFPHVRIGYIGEYIRQLAAQDYGLTEDDFVPMRNGIDPFQPVFRERTDEEKRAKLSEFGIPLDRPIVLSWGRPEVWKGLHWVVEAGAELADRAETVVITAPEWDFLADANAKTRNKVRVIFKFDPELVNSLLQWPNTKVAALVSKGEPFGLTPLEARLNARAGGPVVVVSDTGGMAPQVTPGEDGFHVKTGDVADMVRVFGKVLDLPDAAHARLRAAGLAVVLDRYMWPTNILETWSAICPVVAAVQEDVLKEVRVTEV